MPKSIFVIIGTSLYADGAVGSSTSDVNVAVTSDVNSADTLLFGYSR